MFDYENVTIYKEPEKTPLEIMVERMKAIEQGSDILEGIVKSIKIESDEDQIIQEIKIECTDEPPKKKDEDKEDGAEK